MLSNDFSEGSLLFGEHKFIDAQIFKPFNLREIWTKTLGKDVALDLERGPHFLSSLSREKREWVRLQDIHFRLGVIKEVFLAFIQNTIEMEQAKSKLDSILPQQKGKNRLAIEVRVVERVKRDASSWLTYCQALRTAQNWNAFSLDPQIRASWLEKLEFIEYPNQALIGAESCLTDLHSHFKKIKEELTPTKVSEFVQSLIYPKKEFEILIDLYQKYVKETTKLIKTKKKVVLNQMFLRLQHGAKQNDPYKGHLIQGLLNGLTQPPLEMATLAEAVQEVYKFTIEQKQVFFTLLAQQNPTPLHALYWFNDPSAIRRLRVQFLYHCERLIILPLNGSEIITRRIKEEKYPLSGYLGPQVLPLILYNRAKKNLIHLTDKEIIALLTFIKKEREKAKQGCSLSLLADAWEKTWQEEIKMAEKLVSELLEKQEIPSADVLTAMLAFAPLAPPLSTSLDLLRNHLLKQFQTTLEENRELFISAKSGGLPPSTDRLSALLPHNEGQALKRLTLCWQNKPPYQDKGEIVSDFEQIPLGRERLQLLTCTTLLTCQHPNEKRFLVVKDIDPPLTHLWYEIKKRGLGRIVDDLRSYLLELQNSALSDSDAIESLKVIKAFSALNPDLWDSVAAEVKNFYYEKWSFEERHNPAMVKLLDDKALTYHYGLARFIYLLLHHPNQLKEEETLAELIRGHDELAKDVAEKIRENIYKQPENAPSAQDIAFFLSPNEKTKMAESLDQHFFDSLTRYSVVELAARLEKHHPAFPQTPEAREQVNHYLNSLTQTSLDECRLIHLLGEETYKKTQRIKWLKEVLEGKRPPSHVLFFQSELPLVGLRFIRILYGEIALDHLASMLEQFFSTPTILTKELIDVLKPFVTEEAVHTSRWALLTQQGRKKIELSLKLHDLLESFRRGQVVKTLQIYQDLHLSKRLEAGERNQIYFTELLAKVENELLQMFRVTIDDGNLSECAHFCQQVQQGWLGKLEEGKFKEELTWYCSHFKKLKLIYEKVHAFLGDHASPLLPFLVQLELEEMMQVVSALPKRQIKGLRYGVSQQDFSGVGLHQLECYHFFIDVLGKKLSVEEITHLLTKIRGCLHDQPESPLDDKLLNLLSAEGIPTEMIELPSDLTTAIQRWMMLQWQAMLKGKKILPITKEKVFNLFTRLLIIKNTTLTLPNPTLDDLKHALSSFSPLTSQSEEAWEQAFDAAYKEIIRLDADWKKLESTRKSILEGDEFTINDPMVLHGIPSILEPLELSRLNPVKQKKILTQLMPLNISHLNIQACQELQLQDIEPLLNDKLVHLNASSCPALVPHLLPKLANCPQLTNLRLNRNPIKVFNPSSVLPKLAELFLYDCKDLTTLIVDAPNLWHVFVNSLQLSEIKITTQAKRLLLKVDPKKGAQLNTELLGDYSVEIKKETTFWLLDCKKTIESHTGIFHWKL